MEYIRRNWNTGKSIYACIKRFLDISLAVLGIIALSPAMLIISILIKLDSDGPILFKQKRTGKDGKEFTILKFRTMVKDNDVYDKTKKDKLTKIGKVLRKTGLDEIPQIFNILSGKMSFIGPRPWIKEYYENMNEVQKHRVDVLPGVTGLAQIKGRNRIPIEEKINYDLKYIDDYSFLQDLRTALLTLKKDALFSEGEGNKDKINEELEALSKSKILSKKHHQNAYH